MFPHFHSRSCVSLKFHAATKRFWWFEYKQQRVESWCVLSSKVWFVSSGFLNRGVVSPPSGGGKARCHCRRSEDDDSTVVWRYDKAVFPVKGPQFLCGAMKTPLAEGTESWPSCMFEQLSVQFCSSHFSKGTRQSPSHSLSAAIKSNWTTFTQTGAPPSTVVRGSRSVTWVRTRILW